jgi:hypothetical protein
VDLGAIAEVLLLVCIHVRHMRAQGDAAGWVTNCKTSCWDWWWLECWLVVGAE